MECSKYNNCSQTSSIDAAQVIILPLIQKWRDTEFDYIAGEISLVDITGPVFSDRVVTAVRDGNGNLKLISWAVTG